MWVVWSCQAAQSSRSTHSKVRFQRNPFTPYPKAYPQTPSFPPGCCLAIFRGTADVELVAGTSYSIRLCGLRSLSVAIRGALDWTAETKWAAASALNCENKYWIGLRCASQALSPIVICLGVHTGASVCLGLKPPHVVAARFFRAGSHFLRAHLIKLAAEYEGKNLDSFCTCDNFPLSLLSALVKDEICTNSQSISRCLVETFVSELKERSLGWEDVGHSEEGGKRSTWDRLIWMFGCWRGTCSVANALFLHRDVENRQCCALLHSSFKQRVRTGDWMSE